MLLLCFTTFFRLIVLVRGSYGKNKKKLKCATNIQWIYVIVLFLTSLTLVLWPAKQCGKGKVEKQEPMVHKNQLFFSF